MGADKTSKSFNRAGNAPRVMGSLIEPSLAV
jgi:hypothetical protein